jgi:hypothetical protein
LQPNITRDILKLDNQAGFEADNANDKIGVATSWTELIT